MQISIIAFCSNNQYSIWSASCVTCTGIQTQPVETTLFNWLLHKQYNNRNTFINFNLLLQHKHSYSQSSDANCNCITETQTYHQQHRNIIMIMLSLYDGNTFNKAASFEGMCDKKQNLKNQIMQNVY